MPNKNHQEVLADVTLETHQVTPVETVVEKKQFTTPEIAKLEKVTSLLTDALGHINKVKTRGVEGSEELVMLKNMHTILGQVITKLEKK